MTMTMTMQEKQDTKPLLKDGLSFLSFKSRYFCLLLVANGDLLKFSDSCLPFASECENVWLLYMKKLGRDGSLSLYS